MRAGSTFYKTPMYYTYILYSQKDKKLYIGYSTDLIKRIKEHQNGMATATKNRRPLTLIYYEACLNETDALSREKSLKTGYGRKYLKNRLSNYFLRP